jgi:hypothetical protein
MKSATIASMAVVAASGAAAHPTLPEDWKAVVNQPDVGVVWESYTMVSSPDYSWENPSGLWTNYTENTDDDGSCKRLIHVPNNIEGRRYYLNCYSLDCCYGSQSGNHVEFQIPNVHAPTGRPWPVDDLGKSNITTSFGENVLADSWAWSFTAQSWVVYTTECESCPTGTKLWRWSTSILGQTYNIDFKDFEGFVPETSEFDEHKSTFQVPDQCNRNNLFNCGMDAAADKRWEMPKWVPQPIYVNEFGNEISPPE